MRSSWSLTELPTSLQISEVHKGMALIRLVSQLFGTFVQYYTGFGTYTDEQPDIQPYYLTTSFQPRQSQFEKGRLQLDRVTE